jgi:hypothetical protein
MVLGRCSGIFSETEKGSHPEMKLVSAGDDGHFDSGSNDDNDGDHVGENDSNDGNDDDDDGDDDDVRNNKATCY